MFTVSGKRDFVNPVDRAAVLQLLAVEMSKLGASSITSEDDRLFATDLRIKVARTPTVVLKEFTVTFYEGGTSGIGFDGRAEVEYSARYFALWLLPCLLGTAYAFIVSPLVLIALPLGAVLVRALLPIGVRMWLEKWLHSIEQGARVAARPGA
jgi:hypothetical protein